MTSLIPLGRKRMTVWLSAALIIGFIVLWIGHGALCFMLRRAIENRNLSMVHWILAVDPWVVNLVDDYGDNALGLAVEKDNVEIVHSLIQHGCRMYHD